MQTAHSIAIHFSDRDDFLGRMAPLFFAISLAT